MLHSVVHLTDADEDPHRCVFQSLGRLTGIFQGLPGDFQKQALLGVQIHGLSGRYSEKAGIESIDVRQEAAMARVDLSRGIGIGVEKFVDVPTLRGYFGDGINAAL
uniref:Uncharacterized protein n=1 Tax=Candidatus Kentrum sp. LFY TaxID=2126342 RepID=A0A450WCQ2_9GAMM|nr:MAG: hypothetical protein BECKLFY1418C_GA0070996_101128 [Candidatus Kentron sp. LFY]